MVNSGFEGAANAVEALHAALGKFCLIATLVVWPRRARMGGSDVWGGSHLPGKTTTIAQLINERSW